MNSVYKSYMACIDLTWSSLIALDILDHHDYTRRLSKVVSGKQMNIWIFGGTCLGAVSE